MTIMTQFVTESEKNVISEILLHVQNKIKIMNKESLIKIRTTFYSGDEVALSKRKFFDSICAAAGQG